jgi:hypothetical protein
MSRVLASLSVAVAAAVVGLVGAPAAVASPASAATSALYVVRTGGAVDGLVLQATPAAPNASFVAPSYSGSTALHPGWAVTLDDVRGEALVYPDGSSRGSARMHFSLQDAGSTVPFLRIAYISSSAGCNPQTTWVGGASGLSLFIREGGVPRQVNIDFGQTVILDPVRAGDVASGDFRFTTATLNRVKFADLAGYPQFAHYDATNGVYGLRLRIEQAATTTDPALVYEFLTGLAVCDI